MNYICLAAGRGSRMGNLGSYLQKAMYPVLEKPFLQYSLDALLDSGTFQPEQDRIILVVGHRREQILAYFGTEYRGVPLYYVVQEEALGTGHAVMLGNSKGQPDEPVIVWHGDNYVSAELFRRIRESRWENCVTAAHHGCDRDHKERLDLDETAGRAERVWRGTGPYIETCPWKFSAAAVREMFAAKEDEFRALLNLQKLMDQGCEVGYVLNPGWIHLGGTEPTVPENIYACIQAVYQERTDAMKEAGR